LVSRLFLAIRSTQGGSELQGSGGVHGVQGISGLQSRIGGLHGAQDGCGLQEGVALFNNVGFNGCNNTTARYVQC